MLRYISLKAILLPPMVSFAVPFLLISFLVAPALGAIGGGAAWAGKVMFGMWLLLTLAAPFASGYLGAQLAANTPILHGLTAGAVTLGTATILFAFHGVIAGVLQLIGVGPEASLSLAAPVISIVFIVLALCGAVALKRQRAAVASAA